VKPDVIAFAVATVLPVPLLAIGAVAGGWWLVAALIYLTLFALVLDEMVAIVSAPQRPETEFPAADWLCCALACAHFALMALAVWALSGGTGLGVGERLVAFFAFGIFFGQVSNSNAHELIHRSNGALHEFGKWVFISHLFGHHTSAHRLVHHRHVGTARDPNTARRGQSFYDFAPRAWLGSFRAWLRAEDALHDRGTRKAARLHPYTIYFGGGGGLSGRGRPDWRLRWGYRLCGPGGLRHSAAFDV
jgi:alkane 1-monooxygenase